MFLAATGRWFQLRGEKPAPPMHESEQTACGGFDRDLLNYYTLLEIWNNKR